MNLARVWPHLPLASRVVPNSPKTPKHGVRVPDDLWQSVKRIAADRGETITDVIIRALKRYVRDYGD